MMHTIVWAMIISCYLLSIVSASDVPIDLLRGGSGLRTLTSSIITNHDVDALTASDPVKLQTDFNDVDTVIKRIKISSPIIHLQPKFKCILNGLNEVKDQFQKLKGLSSVEEESEKLDNNLVASIETRVEKTYDLANTSLNLIDSFFKEDEIPTKLLEEDIEKADSNIISIGMELNLIQDDLNTLTSKLNGSTSNSNSSSSSDIIVKVNSMKEYIDNLMIGYVANDRNSVDESCIYNNNDRNQIIQKAKDEAKRIIDRAKKESKDIIKHKILETGLFSERLENEIETQEVTSKLIDEGVDTFDICNKEVCWGLEDKIPAKSGCLYGCSASLQDASDKKLEQIQEKAQCNEYCNKIMNQKIVVDELNDILLKNCKEQDLKTVTEQEQANTTNKTLFLGSCVKGCEHSMPLKRHISERDCSNFSNINPNGVNSQDCNSSRSVVASSSE